MRLRKPHSSLFAAIAYGLLFIVTSEACQVPVFRYALERWEPAPYLLSITPGTNGLTSDEKAIVESLQHPKTPANVEIEIKAPAENPSLTLHDPRSRKADVRRPVWQADLSKEGAAVMLNSPVRDELRKRLLSGQTAVWLLLESGDAAKDNAAHAALQETMKTITEKVKLPDGVVTQDEASQPNPTRRHENADVLQTDLPLKIDFSILRLSRSDQREAALIAMLMRLEPDLGDFIGEPMVFPIFGRGRSLEPLIGKGIHDDNILQTATYLCGACSCEIKDQNPGMDLLISADWSSVDNAPVIETVRIEPKPVLADAPPSNIATKHLRWIAAAAALVLSLGFLLRKSR